VETGRFQRNEQRTMATKLMESTRCTAEHVAQRIKRAIARKELYVLVPGVAGFLWRLKRLMPVRFLKRVAKQSSQASAAANKK
jgi:short-subunit dehydrogenase